MGNLRVSSLATRLPDSLMLSKESHFAGRDCAACSGTECPAASAWQGGIAGPPCRVVAAAEPQHHGDFQESATSEHVKSPRAEGFLLFLPP